tara:strand:- start:1213 stop:1845 length:633 start_codon:yes stop_codon:yes gene_type:complete
MKLDSLKIKELDYSNRIRLINSVSGPKSACLIGTKSKKHGTNLGIFNSITHIGSNPPLIGVIFRPNENVRRDTYDNIINEKFYTINHINSEILERSHWTSIKINKNVSEFDVCNLTEEYIDGFYSPYVMESFIKIGLKLIETVKIEINNTVLVVGEIIEIIINDSFIDKDGTVNLQKSKSISVGGLNTYYDLKKISKFPYTRIENLPEFF